MEIWIFPVVSVMLVFLYLLIFRVDTLLYIMAFVTPLSMPFGDAQIGFQLSLPSEPIMILVMLLFIFRIMYDMKIDKKILKHPITIAIFVYFFWLIITTITSELPMVSLKYVLCRLWFVIPCYFMVIQLIGKRDKPIVTFFTWHAIGVALVVFITTVRHAMQGFSETVGHWIMSPFYNDHTAYGAILAFMLPITIAFIFLPESKKWQKVLYIVLSVILLMGLYLSFSRAAWLGFITGAGVFCILKLRIKLSWCLIGGALIGMFFYFFADDILYKMSRNTQDSSGDFASHIRSISNIKTDASNVERLNRWEAARGMIVEQPVVGWGPGTYQFVYAPFQKGRYKTIISTNFGDGGNAHSEYIGPWAETGTVGLLTVLALVVLILYYGIRTCIRSHDTFTRIIALAMSISLITYYIHGFLNNFLDTDKLALPYWAAFAVIVVLSSRVKEKQSFNSNTDSTDNMDPENPSKSV
jgi:O-antigen ligase